MSNIGTAFSWSAWMVMSIIFEIIVIVDKAPGWVSLLAAISLGAAIMVLGVKVFGKENQGRKK